MSLDRLWVWPRRGCGLKPTTLYTSTVSFSSLPTRIVLSNRYPLRLIAPTFSMASSVDAKLLKATKFPPEFSQKVDMQKVNVEVMKKYGNVVTTRTEKDADRIFSQMDRREDLRHTRERGRRRH